MLTNSLQQTRDSIGSEPSTFTIPRRFILTEEESQTLKVSKRLISNEAIYGNEILGIYGTSEYTQQITTTFILGNTIYGLIGSSQLGDNGTEITEFYVLNQNNIFVETLNEDSFIDTTTSTGTLGTSEYELSEGKVLTSKTIARNNISYTRATVTLTGTNTSSAVITITADGTNYESATDSTEHIFTNTSTDGIKYKITNPTGSGVTITITKIEVRYS